jgi:hypothetical protein
VPRIELVRVGGVVDNQIGVRWTRPWVVAAVVVLIPLAAFGMTRLWMESRPSESSSSEGARTAPAVATGPKPTEAKELARLEGKNYSAAAPVLNRIDPSHLVFDNRDDDFPVALYETEFAPNWEVCWAGRQSDDSTGSTWIAVGVAPRSHCGDNIQDEER